MPASADWTASFGGAGTATRCIDGLDFGQPSSEMAVLRPHHPSALFWWQLRRHQNADYFYFGAPHARAGPYSYHRGPHGDLRVDMLPAALWLQFCTALSLNMRSPPVRGSRRAFLLGAGAASLPALPAFGIVNGAAVTDAEAASTGTVGLYIDLEGCQVCRKGVPATCTGTLVAPDLVLSAKHCIDER